MIDLNRRFTLPSQFTFLLSLSVYLIFTTSLSSTSPIQQEEFLKACCKTKDAHEEHNGFKEYAFGKVVVDPNDPERASVLPIHESSQYKQLIRKRYCVAKDIPNKFICNQYLNDECKDFTQYVKQRVIVDDGWIREIWVADGCKKNLN